MVFTRGLGRPKRTSDLRRRPESISPQVPLIIGIKGTVLALDRATGQELWRTPLKGMSFVNVILEGEQVLATTRGEIYCLDKSGTILWHDPLKGLGQGLVTVATEAGSNQVAVCTEKLQHDAAVAAAAAGGAAAGQADVGQDRSGEDQRRGAIEARGRVFIRIRFT